MSADKHDSTDAAKPQPDKFRDLARQLEVDEDEGRFEEAVRKIVKPPKQPPE